LPLIFIGKKKLSLLRKYCEARENALKFDIKMRCNIGTVREKDDKDVEKRRFLWKNPVKSPVKKIGTKFQYFPAHTETLHFIPRNKAK
jgi:hypothetical protein